MSKAVKSVCLSDHTLVLQYHLLVWLFLEATFAQRKMVIIFLPNFFAFHHLYSAAISATKHVSLTCCVLCSFHGRYLLLPSG